GDGGAAGDGGSGGTPVAANAVEVCQAWCRNEDRGPSCCVGAGFCFEACYDLCEESVATLTCPEEWAAARQCELDFACDDFFRECEPLNGRFEGCTLRAEAVESGACTGAAALCGLSEAECLDAYDSQSRGCASGWNNYVACAINGFSTCADCVQLAVPFGETCDWPSSASEEAPFDPKDCDTLSLPPAGCGGTCPGGADTECGFGTFCDGDVCEAQCVTNTDCARIDSCSVRGRCLPRVFGQPLQCSFLDDPPSGCGAGCPSGATSECPTGTFCTSGVCDATCGSAQECGVAQECSPTGRCENIPLDECSDGRSLDSGFVSDSRVADCSVMGIPIPVDVVFTGRPTAPLQVGSNTYEIQAFVGFSESVVDLLINLTTLLTFLDLTVDVVPTVGTASPSTETLQTSPLPCDLSLQSGGGVGVTFPVSQEVWILDTGMTQELTLENVSATINASGLELILSTVPGGACQWEDLPPSLTFVVP
ncbi:MAG: hypothetical protein WBG86_03840, partial [Polyangiales bacterium]